MAGTSAASLTGLMFVVISLVNRSDASHYPEGIATYSTPTVTHFSLALFLSAILCAPWHSLEYAAIVILLSGVCGLAYHIGVAYRATHSTVYVPDTEDRVWYTFVPFVAHIGMFAGAIVLAILPVTGLFVLAGTILLLIFMGIRNAWDVVTYLAVRGPQQQ